MSSAWWARNKMWMAALIPLLAVALAASAFRLTRIYLPWHFTRPVIAAGNTQHFRQTFRIDTHTAVSRTVDITVDAVQNVSSFDGKRPVAGGTLYRVDLSYAAASDQLLSGCTIELVAADGSRYDTTAGKTDDPGAPSSWTTSDCVPADAPGPSVDSVTNEIVPGPAERPEQWSRAVAIAVPAGVEPTQVRIGWQPPEYAVLSVPG